MATLALLTIVLIATPASGDVSFINSRRSAAGLAPVASSGALASVAHAHSQRMASRHALAHSSDLRAAVSEVLPGWQAVGENVGVGDSVADVNAQFMASAAHRANIMGSYNLAGVGVVSGDDGQVWVTQVFARVPATAPTAGIVRAPTQRVASSTERVVRPRVSRARREPVAGAPPATVEPPKPAPTVAGMATRNGGYQLVGADGGVFSFGNAAFAGSGAELGLSEPIVGGANNRTGDGYVLFGRSGGVFTFGSAGFHGSGSDLPLGGPVVGGAMSPTGLGYTVFAADGGVLAFGDADFYGSAVDQSLGAPVVGGAVTPAGNGYWLVGADGGVYAFGRAPFLGSLVGLGPLRAPIAGIATTPTGNGYWLVGADGGVYAFGDAPFTGSAAEHPPPEAVKAVVAAPSGQGYWLVARDGAVMPFGDLSVPQRRPPSAGPAGRLI